MLIEFNLSVIMQICVDDCNPHHCFVEVPVSSFLLVQLLPARVGYRAGFELPRIDIPTMSVDLRVLFLM